MTTLTPEAAVQRCLDLYNQACDLDDARKDFSPESLARVRRVYRRAVPFLTPDTIDAFLACVTHGLVLQIFDPAEASKLLYAVQIAVGSRRATQQAAQAQTKSESKPAPTPTPTPLPLNRGDASEPQPSRAPSLETASPSPRVGDHEPKPTTSHPPTPLPPSEAAPKAQLAAPQVPQVPRNQVDELLEQLYAGKLPQEHAPAHFDPAVRKAPAQAPPRPSLHTGTHALTR